MSDELVTRDDPKPTPTATTAKKPAPPRPSKKTVELEAIREQLQGGFTLIGGGISMALPATGHALVYQSEDVADSLIKWAKTSPKVARALIAASKTTGFAGVAVALGPVFLAAAVEMGIIPRDAVEALLPTQVVERLPKRIEVPETTPENKVWNQAESA